MSYEREKVLPPSFEGEHAGRNSVDFLIEDKIILEVKVIRFMGREEYYQCLRYLEALNKKLCLLVNFRDKHLKIKRVINPKAKT
jgi:GxxExxY protein